MSIEMVTIMKQKKQKKKKKKKKKKKMMMMKNIDNVSALSHSALSESAPSVSQRSDYRDQSRWTESGALRVGPSPRPRATRDVGRSRRQGGKRLRHAGADTATGLGTDSDGRAP